MLNSLLLMVVHHLYVCTFLMFSQKLSYVCVLIKLKMFQNLKTVIVFFFLLLFDGLITNILNYFYNC